MKNKITRGSLKILFLLISFAIFSNCSQLSQAGDLGIDSNSISELKGTIINSYNNPVANADVLLYEAQNLEVSAVEGNNEDGIPQGVASVKTDQNGNFSIKSIQPGIYNLIAQSTGGLKAEKTNIKIAESENLDLGVLVFKQTGSIQGKAVIEGLSDNLGIRVFIPGTSCIAVTDPQGNFTISSVPEGSYTVYFIKSGCLLQQKETVVVNPQKETIIELVTLKIDNSIVQAGAFNWLGALTTHPDNPSLFDAYFNKNENSSYIYNGSEWTLLAKSGSVGPQGTSINWLGSFNSNPANPSLFDTFLNNTNGNSYIYNGIDWVILAKAGTSSKWLTGFTSPRDDEGNNGDYYLNLNNGQVYHKENNTWLYKSNLKNSELDTPPTAEVQAMLDNAFKLLRTGNFNEAVGAYKQIIEKDSINPMANFVLAIDSMTNLLEDPTFQQLVKDFEERNGLSLGIPGSFQEFVDNQPKGIIPVTSFTTSAIDINQIYNENMGDAQTLTEEVVIPAISQTLQYLNVLINRPNFSCTLTPTMTGLPVSAEFDKGEIYALSAIFNFMQAISYKFIAYDLSVVEIDFKDYKTFLNNNPSFGTLKPTGATSMAQSLSYLKNTVFCLKEGIRSIEAETDEQTEDIIKKDCLFDSNAIVDGLNKLSRSLNGEPISLPIINPVDWRQDVDVKINLENFYLNPITDIRKYIMINIEGELDAADFQADFDFTFQGLFPELDSFEDWQKYNFFGIKFYKAYFKFETLNCNPTKLFTNGTKLYAYANNYGSRSLVEFDTGENGNELIQGNSYTFSYYNDYELMLNNNYFYASLYYSSNRIKDIEIINAGNMSLSGTFSIDMHDYMPSENSYSYNNLFNIEVNNNSLYVVFGIKSYDQNWSDYVKYIINIYDISSDPENPVLENTIEVSSASSYMNYGSFITFVDNNLYFFRENMLDIYNVSDIDTITAIVKNKSINQSVNQSYSYNNKTIQNKNILYVWDTYSLYLYNVENPEAVTFIKSYYFNKYPDGLTIKNNKLLLKYSNTLEIHSLDDPQNIKLEQTYTLLFEANEYGYENDILFLNDYIYLPGKNKIFLEPASTFGF
ncbi:carboxypeptidase regulatory-like domain-containing protein [Candidatus Margulisiibacteriota bacterium]